MGKRVKDAGIQLTVLVLLGIGGREKSLEHAKATGEILSGIDPDFARAHYFLGLTYSAMRDKASAFEEYKILKTLDKELADDLINFIYKY